jgi:hypothetical protein
MEFPVFRRLKRLAGLPGVFLTGNSGGIVGFRRIVVFGPATCLRLAALQVFPQRSRKILRAPILSTHFRPVRHNR